MKHQLAPPPVAAVLLPGSESCGFRPPSSTYRILIGSGSNPWEEDQQDLVLLSCLTHSHRHHQFKSEPADHGGPGCCEEMMQLRGFSPMMKLFSRTTGRRASMSLCGGSFQWSVFWFCQWAVKRIVRAVRRSRWCCRRSRASSPRRLFLHTGSWFVSWTLDPIFTEVRKWNVAEFSDCVMFSFRFCWRPHWRRSLSEFLAPPLIKWGRWTCWTLVLSWLCFCFVFFCISVFPTEIWGTMGEATLGSVRALKLRGLMKFRRWPIWRGK